MSNRFRSRVIVFCSIAICAFAARAAQSPQEKLERQFQAAAAQYESGRFAEAAAQLEEILPRLPNSFEVHELLGLVYASEAQLPKAIEHLETAVRLQPKSSVARTNLAASLSHAGKSELAGEQFRKALELAPHDFDANHNLAEFYIQSGQVSRALPMLEEAQRINPSSYNNGYDLALAYFLGEKLTEARQVIQSIVSVNNTGELHNLLGQIEEKDGKFVAAENEYETAAHMDPSEDNLFVWGSELLLHRTYEPAVDVFQKATERYPNSPRLKIGLGMSLYARGAYDDSIRALIAAANLNPTDPRCYLFLSKAYDRSPNQADDVIRTFKRYADLQPNNALAVYYYAMSLWKGKQLEDASLNMPVVEALLLKALALNEALPEAHLQLGNLYSDQHKYDKSVPQYLRALELEPNLTDAHYRLGQSYVHTGQKEQAQLQFDVYQKLREQHLAEMDKERAEVQQFVYSDKNSVATKPDATRP